MAGIKSIGAYVPLYRLPREAFAKAWGAGGGAGERSVANHDEDTLTLAVSAAVDTLNGAKREDIGGLFFASTTAPYKEKLSATLVATVADLGRQIRTADFSGSIRSGTNALNAALDVVASGAAKNVLVVASDTRLGYPRSDMESTFGDAAAAVIIDNSDVAVEVVDRLSIANEIIDVWRRDKDPFVRTWEDRFVIQHGYDETVRDAVTTILKKNKLTAKDITKAVIYGPDPRSHASLIKALGFDPKTQVQDNLIGSIGNTGAAHALLMLVAALEQAKPGDKILLASYGEGADALILRVTDKIAGAKKGRGVGGYAKLKKTLPSYDRLLAYRGILDLLPEAPLRVMPYAAATIAWRERQQTLRLHGSRCTKCGTTTHPIQRICYTCQSKDEFTEVRLSDKTGTIFSFTRDNLAGGMEPPVLNCIVESDEGQARVASIMTDADPLECKVGVKVRFTFRKFHEGGNFHNYYWKCTPVRDGGI